MLHTHTMDKDCRFFFVLTSQVSNSCPLVCFMLILSSYKRFFYSISRYTQHLFFIQCLSYHLSMRRSMVVNNIERYLDRKSQRILTSMMSSLFWSSSPSYNWYFTLIIIRSSWWPPAQYYSCYILCVLFLCTEQKKYKLEFDQTIEIFFFVFFHSLFAYGPHTPSRVFFFLLHWHMLNTMFNTLWMATEVEANKKKK